MLREPSNGDPALILIGTGSELSICLDAADLLEEDGVPTRVVSMPCFDRFIEQDAAYRDSVLPPSVRARVSVEAAATFGWERWVGPEGESIGMTGFGASGPQPALYEHFGFTPEHVAERGRAVASSALAAKDMMRSPMSVEAQVNERLAALTAAGTSVWLDQIRRSLITSGELERLVREDSLRGVTSNPAIFEKAILGLHRLRRAGARAGGARAWTRTRSTRRSRSSTSRWPATCCARCGTTRAAPDGFVSLEVEPAVAHDTDATIEQAHDFWRPGEPPQPDGQDPRHRGGRVGHRGGRSPPGST